MNAMPPRLPATPLERQASALTELKELHEAYGMLVTQADQDRRTIERQQDRIDLLVTNLQNEQQEKAVINRKLIRLAAAMKHMHILSAEAHEIMLSVQDWQETEAQAVAEQESARQIVATLPQNGF